MRTALRAGVLAVGIVGLDQLVKAWIRGSFQRGEVREVIPGLFELTNTRNTGIAFGLLADAGAAVIVALSVLALVALGALLVINRRLPLIWLPMGMVLGGALGNLFDRLLRPDGVTDYAVLPVIPPFNLADAMITCGVILLVIVLERGERAA